MIDNNSLHSDQKVHEMRLAALPFSQIERREKTLEVRLFDEKRRKISVGDGILFRERETGRELFARVTALYPFSTFKEAFLALSPVKMGFPAGADGGEMHAYYNPEEEKKWGVLVIEISPLP